MSALLYAAKNNHRDVVSLLLAHTTSNAGAASAIDINLQNNVGETILIPMYMYVYRASVLWI